MAPKNDTPDAAMSPEVIAKSVRDLWAANPDLVMGVLAELVKKTRAGDNDDHDAIRAFAPGASKLRGQLEQCRKALSVRRDDTDGNPYAAALSGGEPGDEG